MSRTKNKILDLNSALLQQGKTAAGTHAETSASSALPVSDMPLVLTLDQLSVSPYNPRISRNPEYDEIKAGLGFAA